VERRGGDDRVFAEGGPVHGRDRQQRADLRPTLVGDEEDQSQRGGGGKPQHREGKSPDPVEEAIPADAESQHRAQGQT